MLKLHVVQACQGDCSILEYGTAAKPRFILIDGGPETVYEEHLRSQLVEIRDRGGCLDVAMVSHVDDDHIVGVLALMAELRQQRQRGAQETIGVKELWHNSFSQTLGKDVEDRFKAWRSRLPLRRGALSNSPVVARSISQGDELERDARALKIPLNPKFGVSRIICVDDAPSGLAFGKLHLDVVGPTEKNLRALRRKWLEWLNAQEKRRPPRSPAQAAEAVRSADNSIPNLSSIMVLAECDGRTVLLTGDGRGTDLLKGLAQAKLLTPDKKLKVNVLKLPHHGSQRNITRKFLQTVTADIYVISANGMNGNPDLNTLRWIVQAAKQDGRSIEIYVTNATDSTRELVAECDPAEYGYRLVELRPGEHSLVV